MKKIALALMAASAAVFGFGMVAAAQTTQYGQAISILNPVTAGAPYTVVYANCVVGDTITFTQPQSTPTSVDGTCVGAGATLTGSVVGLLLPQQQQPSATATATFTSAPTPGTYNGTAVGQLQPVDPLPVHDSRPGRPPRPAPTTVPVTVPGGGLPATGSGGIGTTTGIAIGLLVVGLGLFVVAQVRRRQHPSSPDHDRRPSRGVAVGAARVAYRRASVSAASDLRDELDAANQAAIDAAPGCVPLHAAAIDTAAGVIAIAGQSGAGKSTLCAAAVLAGYPYVADEIAAVSTRRPAGAPFHRPIGLRRGGAAAIGVDYPESPDGRYDFVYPWPVTGTCRSGGGARRDRARRPRHRDVPRRPSSTRARRPARAVAAHRDRRRTARRRAS